MASPLVGAGRRHHRNTGGNVGRIAESVTTAHTVERVHVNKVDRVLDALDDEDRAVVLSWLRDPLTGEEEIEDRLHEHGIACSDSTVRRWRRLQAKGRGRVWGE
jgi:hypothetical protein